MTGMAKLGWHGVRKRANGKFQARWCDADGLQSEMFLSKEQASTYATRKANEALDVMVGLAVLSKPIDEARAAFLDRRTKPNTRALNERRIDEFLAAMPAVKGTHHLTSHVINQYARILEKNHNPGGQEHHLKIVRAFTNFCRTEKWLTDNPFEKFSMPKSEFEARPLTLEEHARIVSPTVARRRTAYKEFDRRPDRLEYRIRYIDWNGAVVSAVSGIKDEAVMVSELARVQAELDAAPAPTEIREGDEWLTRAFRFGHSTMLRISQVWKLTPADFTAPNFLRIDPIKGQERVTIVLQPDAVAILEEILAIRAHCERFFFYWGSVQSLRNAVEDKVKRSGILPTVYTVNEERREVYPRFHDICKVSRVSELSRDGYSPAVISHLSNTSQATLIKHYIKADRTRAFEEYVSRPNRGPLGHTRATTGPQTDGFAGSNAVQPALEGTTSTTENASTSQ
jgi:integrase